MEGAAKIRVVAVLLSGLLVCVALGTSCGGDEEGIQDPSPEQDTQPAGEERSEAPGKKSGGKAGDGEATLEMRGDEGTEFSGSCTVGDETSEIVGQPPESFTYELDGEQLGCAINANGNLEVVLTTAGNTRSVQQFSGGTLNLTYENGQVSSSITSSGTGGSSSSSQVVSSSQSGSSSIQISP